jgi:hypothetical protein
VVTIDYQRLAVAQSQVRYSGGLVAARDLIEGCGLGVCWGVHVGHHGPIQHTQSGHEGTNAVCVERGSGVIDVL